MSTHAHTNYRSCLFILNIKLCAYLLCLQVFYCIYNMYITLCMCITYCCSVCTVCMVRLLQFVLYELRMCTVCTLCTVYVLCCTVCTVYTACVLCVLNVLYVLNVLLYCIVCLCCMQCSWGNTIPYIHVDTCTMCSYSYLTCWWLILVCTRTSRMCTWPLTHISPISLSQCVIPCLIVLRFEAIGRHLQGALDDRR